jgi:hypothetical protein
MNWFKSFWKKMKSSPAGGGQSPGAASGNSSAGGNPKATWAAGGQSASDAINKFTPRAQQVLALSRKEADRFNHNFVGTEHLLLGLIRLGQGTAVAVLGRMGLDLETVRAEVERQVGTGPEPKMMGIIPYTPRVKKVLALAAKEARALNHTYVGTEHILLGLLREGDGVAPRVLKNLGINTEQTRAEILRELDPNIPRTAMDTNPSESPQTANLPKPQLDAVDTGKRYDVYCVEGDQGLVVYRNALFKGRRRLLNTRPHEVGSEFIELEQSNGQTVYVALFSVRKFCEHGGEMTGESVPRK